MNHPHTPAVLTSRLISVELPDGRIARRRVDYDVTHAVCVLGMSEKSTWFVRSWTSDPRGALEAAREYFVEGVRLEVRQVRELARWTVPT